jgi:hypothetical protein
MAAGEVPDPARVAAEMGPIRGYGDYSALSYGQVPWDEVVAAKLQCLVDQGWPVEANGPRGISAEKVPVAQNFQAQVDELRCEAGLALPDMSTTTSSDVGRLYDFLVGQIAPFLEAEGFDVPEPPSRDAFMENYPNVDWSPWGSVPDSADHAALDKQCPPDF